VSYARSVARHLVVLLVIACACASGGEGEAGANGAGGAGGLAGHGGAGAGGDAGGASGAGGIEGVCGNGVAETDEACDQRDFAGKTCESYGLGPGTLICNAFCQVVVTSCSEA